MCIIIYTPDGHIPKKHLKNSLAYNDDGWGVMWPENGVLQICTGMEAGEFWKNWKWIGKLRVPKVFHARIGTHGTKDLDNCHPFAIPSHGQLAVAHNGIISKQAGGSDGKSDTRNFVDDVLAKLPLDFLESDGILEMMSDYIGHSKLVFMNGDGDTHIVNAKLGWWEDKRWYSNQSHRWQKTHGSSTTYYNATNATSSQLGFYHDTYDARSVKQENFPVFKEDEDEATLLRARQHGSYDDYDMANDTDWQQMVKDRLNEAANRSQSSCGIGVPAAVLGDQKADAAKTGLATMEDIERGRRQELKKLEEIIRHRYPEDSPGAIRWRVENEGKYPCTLPDPAGKYQGYCDL